MQIQIELDFQRKKLKNLAKQLIATRQVFNQERDTQLTRYASYKSNVVKTFQELREVLDRKEREILDSSESIKMKLLDSLEEKE